MTRPKMDRPRERRGSPFTRGLGKVLKAGLLIVGVVLVVGSLPVLFLWLYADDAGVAGDDLAYRDVDVFHTAGDVQLAGRLRMPPWEGPHPALVVAHGSGRSTRASHDALGRDLALNGFALLTYDKRGVGESGGTYRSVGPANSEEVFDVLAGDVIAGVEYLKSRDDIRDDQIGVLGISQGGWIAPLAAVQSDAISFLVVISGPAVTVGEEIFYSELTGEKEGPEVETDEAELSARLAEFAGEPGFDPLPVLRQLEIPVLWILGDADRSIPVPETMHALDELVVEGRPLAVELLPGVGHGMRDVASGQPAPVFPILYRWLVQNVTGPVGP